MHLSTRERTLFLLIILSFLLGSLFLLLTPLLVRQETIRRAWVPEVTGIVRQAVIGSPSSIVSEVQAILGQREEVPLPPPGSGYNTGFLVVQDGFSFRNYGTRFPQGNLTIKEVWELFGDATCTSISGESCVPTPAAQLWIDAMNDFMADGHCAGFTIASFRFFEDQLDQAQFTPGALTTFSLERNVPTMRQIAKEWVLQTAEEVWGGRMAGTPRDIIDQLLSRSEPVDLGIFGRTGGGHSVLAYGVEDKGDGIYHILAYDNNWPGQELFVEVDYRANTWRYSLAANNPAEDPKAWEGDAHTNSLIFMPFELYEQRMTCPFCEPSPDYPSSELTFIALSGETGALQVTDEEGQRLGHFDDEFIEEIPGSHLVRLKDAMFNNREPLLFMVTGPDFNVQVVPRPGEPSAEGLNLRVAGPSLAVAVENLSVEAGQADSLAVSADNNSVSYTPSGDASPIIKISTARDGVSTMVTVSGADLGAGQSLDLSIDPQTGQLAIGGTGLVDTSVSVMVVKIDASGPVVFANGSVPVVAGGSVALDVADWNGTGPMNVNVDPNGTGNYVPAQPLDNQPLSQVFGSMSSPTPNAIISTFNDMAPYLSPAQVDDYLDALADVGILSANDIGKIVFDFGLDNISDDQLVNFIQQLDLPTDDLATTVFQLHLDDNGLNSLINNLDLTDDQVADLSGGLAALDQLNTLLDDIDFLNYPDGSSVVAYINSQQDLTPFQLSVLVDDLGLDPDTIDLPSVATSGPPPADGTPSAPSAGAPPSAPSPVGQLPAVPTSPPPGSTPPPPASTSPPPPLAPTSPPPPPAPTDTSPPPADGGGGDGGGGDGDPAPAPEITIAPLSLAFGSQDVDVGATAAQAVLITNDGTADLSISSVSLVGASAADFNIASDTGEATLTPGSSRTVQVVFNPGTAGAKSASLRIQSDDSDEPTVDVSLSGTGADQEITVAPLSLSFGSQDIGAGATAAQAVVITNDGTVTLNISSVSLAGTDPGEFTITGDTGEASLAPAATRTVNVAFDPGSTGPKNAVLRIQSDDSDEPTVDVTLDGTGTVSDLTLEVDTAADNNALQTCDDATPNDCSLRGAISKANADPANAYTINLPLNVTLAVAGAGEDNNATGDLDITDDLTINGVGATTTIDGNALDRVFHILNAATVVLNDLTIQNGNASGGGGVYNQSGSTTINHSTITGNLSPGNNGGGILNGSLLNLNSSTIKGNSSQWGGGVYNASGGTLNSTNSTISGNSSSNEGGGIYNWSTVNVFNSTIANNTGGSGIHHNGGSLNLTNSLVTHGVNPDCAGTLVASINSNDYNIDSDNTCNLNQPNDQPGVSPNLGPLQNNGGSTDTHALLAGSPAIDQIPNGTNGCATTITTDQRGITRPQGGSCDVGAFEALPAFTLLVDRTDDTNAAAAQVCNEASPNDCSLRGAISKANADTANAYTINLPAGAYTLSIAGTGENGNATGDLDITDDLTINGAGAGSTSVNANGVDRVFQVISAINATFNDLTLTGGNQAGGAIYIDTGAVIINRSVLANNTNTGGGSALRLQGAGTLSIFDSTVSNNTDNNNNGAAAILSAGSGAVNIVNSTVSGNASPNLSNPNGGGGLQVGPFGTGSVTIRNSTFANNSVGSGPGGGIALSGSLAVSIQNSIFFNNTPSACDRSVGTGTYVGSNNLIDNPNLCSGISIGTVTNFDSVLQDNGGNTQTHALLAGSNAIGTGTGNCPDHTGTPLPTDQRGVVRPQGANCDIGAFELDGAGAASLLKSLSSPKSSPAMLYLPLITK